MLLQGHLSSVGRGSLGPRGQMFPGGSFTKSRAGNPSYGSSLLGQPIGQRASYDIKQLGPSYLQILCDAIMKSLSLSANQAESVWETPLVAAPTFVSCV